MPQTLQTCTLPQNPLMALANSVTQCPPSFNDYLHDVGRIKQRITTMLLLSPRDNKPLSLSQTTSVKTALLSLTSSLLMFFTSMPCIAISYGIYDSRAMAMGGSATAVGNYAQAAFYNPALLGFHDRDEERGRDGRVYLPNLVVQASEGAESAVDAVDDDLDTQLSTAVNNYNNQPDATNAGAVANAARDLGDVLDDISNRDLSMDAFVGFNISEPSDREGGSFYFGARVIGGGLANITEADSALLDDYIEAMDMIAAGADPATVAAQYPQLVDGNGQLADPTDTLTSNADVSALAIGEWGMAMAKQWTFWGQAFSFGITPKLMRVDAYRDTADFTEGAGDEETSDFSDSRTTEITFNADFGMAVEIAEHYRISLAIKDIAEKSFETEPEIDPVTGEELPPLEVTLSPRSRIGFAYVGDNFSVGLDYDLDEAKPMANELTIQELCLGAEYVFFNNYALRAGYRTDQTGLREDFTSVGLGYQWKRFVADISYATGGDMQGAGLQLGWTF